MTTIVTSPFADPHMQKLAEWTASMLDASGKTASEIGCSPAAVVAQAAQESGWGASAIGNNIFGIKADSSWAGTKRLVRTWEHLDGQDVMMDCWFRDYPTLADGIEDHFEFLRRNSRYAKCFDPTDSKSDGEYFEELAAAGYATDPKYAERLCEMLDSVYMLMAHTSQNGAAPIITPRLLLIGCSPGPDVELLQSALKAGGFYSGKLDQDFGPLTKDAVVKFQAYKGLSPIDGIVGKGTRAALGI